MQLAELVAMPSVSAIDPAHDMSNIGVVERLHEWFSDLGLDCRREPVSTTPEKQNVIGRIGAGSGGLILSGHTDTVPFDRQRRESGRFKLDERDGCWFGSGSAYMKVFVPCVIAALNGIDRHSFKQPLTVLATADEESTLADARDGDEAQLPPRYGAGGIERQRRPDGRLRDGKARFSMKWVTSRSFSDPQILQPHINPMSMSRSNAPCVWSISCEL